MSQHRQVTGLCVIRAFLQDSGGVVIEVLTDTDVDQATHRRVWRGTAVDAAVARVHDFLDNVVSPSDDGVGH